MSQRLVAAMLVGLSLAVTLDAREARAQSGQSAQNEEFFRRAKTKEQPIYPELARKMSITGIVRIEVVVLPNGAVKEAHVLGGHPVLANAALDAAKRWRFEPASAETTGVIEFRFQPR